MSQIITIRIDVPDGTTVRVLPSGVPDDFEYEPLPTGTYASDETFDDPAQNGHAAPYQAPAVRTIAAQPHEARRWQPGDVHIVGHKPLRANSRGLFCPTKENGVFCDWRA